MWGIYRSPVNSPHKGQWRGALMFSLICAWINTWVNNCEAGDLRRYRAHYDVIVMIKIISEITINTLPRVHVTLVSDRYYWVTINTLCGVYAFCRNIDSNIITQAIKLITNPSIVLFFGLTWLCKEMFERFVCSMVIEQGYKREHCLPTHSDVFVDIMAWKLFSHYWPFVGGTIGCIIVLST